MADKDGWVYVLTNDVMPGLVKIGYTMKDPAIRAEDLSSETGVPIPYVVNYKALVVDPYQVEQQAHKALDRKRLNDKREFFTCELSEAISVIRQIGKIKYEETSENVDIRNLQYKAKLPIKWGKFILYFGGFFILATIFFGLSIGLLSRIPIGDSFAPYIVQFGPLICGGLAIYFALKFSRK